jgi:hypothetical protein
MNGRQRWAGQTREQDVIHTNHRDIFWNTNIGFLQRADGTDSDQVIPAEQCSRQRTSAKKDLYCRRSAINAIVAFHNLVATQPALCKAIEKGISGGNG